MRGGEKENILELIREGILIPKTGYGKHISMNVEKHEKIMDYIDEFLRID